MNLELNLEKVNWVEWSVWEMETGNWRSAHCEWEKEGWGYSQALNDGENLWKSWSEHNKSWGRESLEEVDSRKAAEWDGGSWFNLS